MSESTPLTHTPTRKKANRRHRAATPRQRLLTLVQAEQEYGPPYRTWYDQYLRGRLPVIRINRTLWADRNDIERLLAESKTTFA